MLNPTSINISELPFLPFSQRKQLPKVSAIYFVLEGEKVIYIGKANKLYNRWLGHHRAGQLSDCHHLAWLEVRDRKLLPEIERALISYFHPLMNRAPVPGVVYDSVKVVRQLETYVPNLHERIKEAREKDGRSVQVLATLAGISTAYWYKLEAGTQKWISEDVLRRIEQVLGIDFGVNFEKFEVGCN
jgi:Helix-turn-helix domain